MFRGLYSAATGVEGALRSQEVAAENLAHASVPGYRRHGLAFETFEGALAAAGAAGDPAAPAEGTATTSLLGARSAGDFTVFESGGLQYTGNPLDVAATGDAFFVIDGPRGPLLTRNGTFTLNAQNELTTADGLRVRGRGGAITLPQDTSLVTINLDGVIYADGAEIDRLQIATVPNPQILQRAGTSLFEGFTPRDEPEPGTVRIQQGYREAANVQVVPEMVGMLSSLRLLEASDRAMRALSDAVGLNTRPQT